MNKMQPELVHITPSLAASWLKYNEGNRRLPVGNSKHYARLIEAGEFQLTHQALAFSGTKANPIRLLDGQTRLTAVIQTGIPIWQWVFWNTPDSTFTVLDGGKTRSFSDHHGWEKQKIAFVNVIHWFGPAGLRKITKGEADKIWSAFGGCYEQLMEVCPSQKKGVTCSAVKVGTVIAMHRNPKQRDEIASAYRALALGHMEEMPVSVGRLFVKLLTVVGGGRDAIMVQLPFTEKAMTPRNFPNTKLYGPDKNYFQELAAYIEAKANL
jgi:hypothetical protein